MILFHSTRRAALTAHVGLCLTDSERATYGEHVYTVEIDTSAIKVVEVVVSREDIDLNIWPGDSKRSLAALAADGIDLVVYEDMDPSGRTHTTYRLVTDAAVAAVASIEMVAEESDEDEE